jgi:ribokinase
MDMVFRISAIPQRGETVLGEGFFMNPGGKGANQAVACARQGAQVRMVGCVGGDVFGEKLLAGLAEDGIDASFVRKSMNMATATALILITGNDNRIVVEAGANVATSPALIESALADAGPGDVFLTQMEIPYDSVRRGLEIAKAKGMFTVLNPAPARILDDDLLGNVDLIVPNETEAETITGIPVRDSDSAFRAIRTLLDRGARDVVITLGAEGCVHGGPKGLTRYSACPVDVVDTTAAGDTFIGTIAAAITRGMTVADSLPLANAAAAVTISRLGAQCSIPDTAEIEGFIRNGKGS